MTNTENDRRKYITEIIIYPSKEVYKKGDEILIVLVRKDQGSKLNSPTERPYTIERPTAMELLKLKKTVTSKIFNS